MYITIQIMFRSRGKSAKMSQNLEIISLIQTICNKNKTRCDIQNHFPFFLKIIQTYSIRIKHRVYIPHHHKCVFSKNIKF